jgi:predicted nucleotidyltransferase
MALFTTHQLNILALLTGHPEREYNFTEIGEALGISPGVFQRGINSLEKQGILTSHKRGNQRLFKVNLQYPLLNEIKAIIQKTGGIKPVLREIVQALPEIETAIIYGSYAKNTVRADSDIDVLLVVTNPGVEDKVIEQFSTIEIKVQREINYKLYSKEEFK